jgi:hypothetical protein
MHLLPNWCGFRVPASPTKCAKSTGGVFLANSAGLDEPKFLIELRLGSLGIENSLRPALALPFSSSLFVDKSEPIAVVVFCGLWRRYCGLGRQFVGIIVGILDPFR